jgi:hypothetical protein
MGVLPSDTEMEVDEDLPKFFETLTTSMASIPVSQNKFSK